VRPFLDKDRPLIGSFYSRFQKQLAAYELLIVDELGYAPMSKTGAELLFEIQSRLDQIQAGNRKIVGTLEQQRATSSTTLTSASTLFQKASKNSPRKPPEINGRISPIRPFKKGIAFETYPRAGPWNRSCAQDSHWNHYSQESI